MNVLELRPARGARMWSLERQGRDRPRVVGCFVTIAIALVLWAIVLAEVAAPLGDALMRGDGRRLLGAVVVHRAGPAARPPGRAGGAPGAMIGTPPPGAMARCRRVSAPEELRPENGALGGDQLL